MLLPCFVRSPFAAVDIVLVYVKPYVSSHQRHRLVTAFGTMRLHTLVRAPRIHHPQPYGLCAGGGRLNTITSFPDKVNWRRTLHPALVPLLIPTIRDTIPFPTNPRLLVGWWAGAGLASIIPTRRYRTVLKMKKRFFLNGVEYR